jgi:hypothetical protein
VNFYEVLADGYHSPLTKSQIAELFHARRLSRHHPCKLLSQKQWRTIDELFPLLKHQSAGPASYYSPETDARSSRIHMLIFAFLLAVVAAGALWYFLASDVVEHTSRPRVIVHDWPKTIPTNSSFNATVPRREQTADIAETAPVTIYSPARTIDSQQMQVAEQRRQAEQQQREQSERERLRAERANLERKAAGHDLIIPLDEDSIVNFGGMSIRVKIHDNDVTTFDVWINGEWHRAVPKQKGISHSGTDETLIYNAGHARLYYVWEISGTLNHCRLRIRED